MHELGVPDKSQSEKVVAADQNIMPQCRPLSTKVGSIVVAIPSWWMRI